MNGVKFSSDGLTVTASTEPTDWTDGETLKSKGIEACLLFSILEKLEDIRCQGVDIETAIERSN